MKSKIFKLLSFICFSAFGLCVVAYLSILLVFPKSFNSDYYIKLLGDEFHSASNLNLLIEDLSVKSTMKLNLSFNAHHLQIVDNDNKEVLRVKDATINLKVLPILFKKLVISNVNVERPILTFEIDDKGNTSLDEYLKYGIDYSKNKKSSFINQIENVDLNNYRIKIYEKGYKEPFLLEGDLLKIKNYGNKFDVKIDGNLSKFEKKYINLSSDIKNISMSNQKLFEANPFKEIRKYNLQADINADIKFVNKDEQNLPVGNISISDLSLNLDNKKLSDNHIDLGLGEDKLKVDADLKLSGKEYIKVFGDIFFKKNPEFDLKINSSDLNLKDLKKISEIILNTLNVKNDLNSINVLGGAKLDFSLKGNSKKFKSDGVILIKNAEITNSKLKYYINRINSKINLENNNINIQDTSCFLEGFPLNLKGSIKSDGKVDIEINGNNLDINKLLKIFAQNEFADFIINGKTDFKSKITGKISSLAVDIDANLFDNVISSKQGRILSFSKGNIVGKDIMNGVKVDFKAENTNIMPYIFNNALRTNNLNLQITNDEINIKDNKLVLGNGELVLNALIKNYNKPELSFNSDLEGVFESKKLEEILINMIPNSNYSYDAIGKIPVKMSFSGNNDKVDFKINMKPNGNNYVSVIKIKNLTNKPSEVNIEGQVENNNLYLKNLNIKNLQNNNDELSLNGEIDNVYSRSNQRFKNLKINIPNETEFSIPQYKNSFINVYGNAILNGNAKNPDVNGNVIVKSINIPDFALRGNNISINIANSIAKTNIQNLIVGNTVFNLDTEFVPKLNNNGEIEFSRFILNSNVVDLPDLRKILSAFPRNTVTMGYKLPAKILDGKLNINKLILDELRAMNISADMKLEKNILNLTNVRGIAYNGQITGEINYDFLTTTTNSVLEGKNTEISYILKDLGQTTTDISGNTDFKLNIKTVGETVEQQKRTMNGDVKFVIRNGKMGQMGMFEHYLNAQNFVNEGILNSSVRSVSKLIAPQNTSNFNVAKGHLKINGTTIEVDEFASQGDNMSIFAQGQLSTVNDIVNFNIYGRISQNIENLLGNLTSPTPQNILTTGDSSSLDGLFYSEYNTRIPIDIVNKIPNVKALSGANIKRLFTVKINGNAKSVKSVKSFKWVNGFTDMNGNTVIQKNTLPEKKYEIPQQYVKFLDDIPDNFKN